MARLRRRRKPRWNLYRRVAREFWPHRLEGDFETIIALIPEIRLLRLLSVLRKITGRRELAGYDLFKAMVEQGSLSTREFVTVYRLLPLNVRRLLEKRALRIIHEQQARSRVSLRIPESVKKLLGATSLPHSTTN